jgi:hypothetical protein
MAVVVLPTPPFWLTTAMTFDGGGAGFGLLTGWMVIICVRRRVSGGGFGGNADGLCRSAEGCGELVEGVFCGGILRVLRGTLWKSFVPRGTLSIFLGKIRQKRPPTNRLVGSLSHTAAKSAVFY